MYRSIYAKIYVQAYCRSDLSNNCGTIGNLLSSRRRSRSRDLFVEVLEVFAATASPVPRESNQSCYRFLARIREADRRVLSEVDR